MNTTDITTIVQSAIDGGYGLWVDTDMGELDLFGSDLEEFYADLTPGEGFYVLGVILDNERKEI